MGCSTIMVDSQRRREACDKKDFLVRAFSVLGGGQDSRMSRTFTLISSDASTKLEERSGKAGIGLSDLGFPLLGLLCRVCLQIQ